MRRSLYHNIKHTAGMAATSISSNTTTLGTEIDLAASPGDWRTVLFLVTAGTVTDGTYALSIQHSDSSGTGYAAVTGSDNVIGPSGTLATTGDTAEIEYTGNKRYVKVAITSTGVTTGGSISARAVLGGTAAGKR